MHNTNILDRRPVKYNITYIEGNYCTQILPISIWINWHSYKYCSLHCLVNGFAQESVGNRVTYWDKILDSENQLTIESIIETF